VGAATVPGVPMIATRSRLSDAGVIVVALFGVVMSLGPSRPVAAGESPAWWWADLVLGVLAAGLLLLRRRRPVALTAVEFVLGVLTPAVWLAGAVATFGVAVRRPWPVALAVGAGAVALAPLQFVVRDRTPTATSLGTFAYAALVLAALVACGIAVRGRQQLLAAAIGRAELAEGEAALRADAARTAERTRIAREMHDVLAHRLSLVSMHAAALAHRRAGAPQAELDPRDVDDALEVIRAGAQEALRDLRAILGVLRAPDDGADGAGGPGGDRTPMPTLDDLGRLLDEVRAAGTPVALVDELDGGAAAVPATCGRTLYRIVQEALTNAARHAPGEPVDLRLCGGRGRVAALEVSNPIPFPAVPGTRGGAGLVGIAERVALAGGRVLARGPDGGRFRVAVEVPWPGDTR
jgi:signal transduction histidine kinase